MNVGLALRAIRKKKGLMEKEVYLSAGVSQGNLYSIENSPQPRFPTLERICQVMGVPVSAALLYTVKESEIPAEHLEFFRKLKQDIIK